MKKYLLVIIAVAFLTPSLIHAAGAVVQSKACYVSTTCTFTSNVTAGNVVLVITSGDASQASITVTDTQINSFSHDFDAFQSSATGGVGFNTTVSTLGGADTITRTAGSDNGLYIAEISGLQTPTSVDKTDSAVTIGTNLAPKSNSFATSNSTDFLATSIIEEASANSGSAGSGYALFGSMNGQFSLAEYSTGNIPGTYQTVFTVNSANYSAWLVSTVAYKELATAPQILNQFSVAVGRFFEIFSGRSFLIK